MEAGDCYTPTAPSTLPYAVIETEARRMELAEAALHSDPDWIFITTWNEWWEHTYIEPSESYGDQYLEITR
ncbi:MAG: glycoside hydrolase family 99-like domain-containing protein [Anaerolineae bacterium]